jgi:tetratricopeptide (TPR) repeat protein
VSSRALSRAPLVVALAIALLAAPGALGDRLHLENGGVIDAERWWIDGDWLHYDSAGGTIAVPRSLVVRIETGAEAQERGFSSFNDSGSAQPAPPVDREKLETTIRAANAALERRDFETASRLYYDVMIEAPESWRARAAYAACEMALGHDGMALSAVLDGLVRDPERAELNELLGELRYRDERLEDAVRAWRKAFQTSPTDRVRDKIIKAERELAVRRDFDFATSSHFNVRYDGDVDMSLAAAAMDFLEEQYWELTGAFAHAPAQPITVVLYATRQFREATRMPEWVGGVYDGKIQVPLGGLSRLDPAAQRVLVHELTHAIVHSKTRANCPRWLHEGLAQRMEGRTLGRVARQQVRELLQSTDPTEWESAGFSYPVALSEVGYLESRSGFDGLVRLLDLLALGQPLEEAMRRVYGEGFASSRRRWAASVENDSG